jgi:hypothetical protein
VFLFCLLYFIFFYQDKNINKQYKIKKKKKKNLYELSFYAL